MENKLFFKSPTCEIVSGRIFSVSQTLLFSAFKDPEILKKWWGPEGFSNTFKLFEFREGGKWEFIMHGPEKGNFPNEVEFVKIVEPHLIAWKRYSKPLFKVVFTFEALDEQKTSLEFRMIFDTEEECNKIKGFVVGKNEENFDRLEAVLRDLS